MIKVTNRKEFTKCCKLMNSIDKESRLLGWSLIQDCMEIPENLYITVITKIEIIDYEFKSYMFNQLCGLLNQIKFGKMLYDLTYKKEFTHRNQKAKLTIHEHIS